MPAKSVVHTESSVLKIVRIDSARARVLVPDGEDYTHQTGLEMVVVEAAVAGLSADWC